MSLQETWLYCFSTNDFWTRENQELCTTCRASLVPKDSQRKCGKLQVEVNQVCIMYIVLYFVCEMSFRGNVELYYHKFWLYFNVKLHNTKFSHSSFLWMFCQGVYKYRKNGIVQYNRKGKQIFAKIIFYKVWEPYKFWVFKFILCCRQKSIE